MAFPGQTDGAVGHSFGLEFDGVMIKQITEVSGLKMEQDKIELKQNTNDGKYSITNLPGRPKAGQLSVSRALTADKSFETWINDSRFGKMGQVRKTGSVIVFDYEGSEVKRYNLVNAWPVSLEVNTMKAGATDVLTEKLTISFEELKGA